MSSGESVRMSLAFLTGADKSQLLRALVADGEDIRVVVLPFSTRREERLAAVIAAAEENCIQVARPRRSGLESVLRENDIDVVVTAGYPYILTKEQLSVAQYNINVHPTLLPRFRGPATSWHVIAYGEAESGVTVIKIDEGMDTGPILAQVRVSLTPFDTVRSLMRKTGEQELTALRSALSRLRAGDADGLPQDESQATVFKEFRTAEDSRVDPNKTLNELYDFVRACDPERFPAFFEVFGQRVGIRLFRLNRPRGEEDML